MKRNNDILSMFQKHEAKVKKNGVSSSPSGNEAPVPSPPPAQPDVDVVQSPDVVSPLDIVVVAATDVNPTPAQIPLHSSKGSNSMPGSSSSGESVYNVELLPHDPGKRKPIASYPINEQDAVRRGFVAKGPCQPRNYNYPIRQLANRPRQFSLSWFDKYPWIEYSVERDAAFCFVCYLFKDKFKGANNSFVKDGWSNWNKCQRLNKHEGGVKSIHNQAQEKFNFFLKQESSIPNVLVKISREDMRLYIARLTHSLRCVRFILNQGLAFRGKYECEESSNKGNFLELLTWLAESNEEIDKIVLNNAPGNCQLKCPSIQKEIANFCASETTRHIIEELGDDHFSILADESSDASYKEQLALCLRYVDKQGRVCERFLGVIHVADTTSLSLKEAIESLLGDHDLTLTHVRGQGYDGASNMKGEIKGLKTLIMKESPSAYYIHCFAHQLQLVLVSLAKNNVGCGWFFDQVSQLLNVIGVSCKRHDMLRNVRAQELLEALEDGELESGRGLNQQMGLARPAETRWGSHYRTIVHIITLYSTMRKVLTKIGNDPAHKHDWLKIHGVLGALGSYELVFNAHLMLVILGYTDELSQSLQKRDQDIINAMYLVSMAKKKLQRMREDGWEDFHGTVNSFCKKYAIKVPQPTARYVPYARSPRCYPKQTIDDHYRREVYLGVVDSIRQELDNRFDEINMELLVCMSALNPVNSFAAYDRKKVLKLAEFYPYDFSQADLLRLSFQLDNFIDDMRMDDNS